MSDDEDHVYLYVFLAIIYGLLIEDYIKRVTNTTQPSIIGVFKGLFLRSTAPPLVYNVEGAARGFRAGLQEGAYEFEDDYHPYSIFSPRQNLHGFRLGLNRVLESCLIVCISWYMPMSTQVYNFFDGLINSLQSSEELAWRVRLLTSLAKGFQKAIQSIPGAAFVEHSNEAFNKHWKTYIDNVSVRWERHRNNLGHCTPNEQKKEFIHWLEKGTDNFLKTHPDKNRRDILWPSFEEINVQAKTIIKTQTNP